MRSTVFAFPRAEKITSRRCAQQRALIAIVWRSSLSRLFLVAFAEARENRLNARCVYAHARGMRYATIRRLLPDRPCKKFEYVRALGVECTGYVSSAVSHDANAGAKDGSEPEEPSDGIDKNIEWTRSRHGGGGVERLSHEMFDNGETPVLKPPLALCNKPGVPAGPYGRTKTMLMIRALH